jgi:phosphomevalonate kinase
MWMQATQNKVAIPLSKSRVVWIAMAIFRVILIFEWFRQLEHSKMMTLTLQIHVDTHVETETPTLICRHSHWRNDIQFGHLDACVDHVDACIDHIDSCVDPIDNHINHIDACVDHIDTHVDHIDIKVII